MFSLTLCIWESVSVASAEDTSLPRKGNRALIPRDIHFNGVHGSKTMGMPIGSNGVQEERALTPALSEVPILLMVPGSRRSEFVALPYISPLFACSHCQYQLFFTADGMQGESCAFCPAHLWLVAWRREDSSSADLPVLLDTEINRNICLWALLNSAVVVCSTKKLLFVCFHSSLGLGNKRLKDSCIFQGCFQSEIMQNIHR